MATRSYRTEFILVIVTIGIISMMAVLNDVNRQIRIRELRIYMQKSNREDNNLDHMGLVLKYRLHKMMYEGQIRQDEADLIEMRVNSIIAESAFSRKVPMDRYRILAVPTLLVINMFRMIMNKVPIQDQCDDPVNTSLDIAYYYERNNCYARALEIYDSALREERRNRTTLSSILLHQGYCNSIIGNYQVARNKYLSVIRNYGDKPVSVTAIILLRYLDGFRQEMERILKNDRDSVEKSEKLFRLIAYREALEVLARLEKSAPATERPRMLYIRARCLEGLSEKEKSIDTYQEIISGNAASPFAVPANRRIYISASLATNGRKVTDLAARNNRALPDPVFEKMLDQEKKLRQADDGADNVTFRKELEQEEIRFPALRIDRVESLSHGTGPAPAAGKGAGTAAIKIETSEGNVFVGTIEQETSEAVILNTMIGRITIPKSKIIGRRQGK